MFSNGGVWLPGWPRATGSSVHLACAAALRASLWVNWQLRRVKDPEPWITTAREGPSKTTGPDALPRRPRGGNDVLKITQQVSPTGRTHTLVGVFRDVDSWVQNLCLLFRSCSATAGSPLGVRSIEGSPDPAGGTAKRLKEMAPTTKDLQLI